MMGMPVTVQVVEDAASPEIVNEIFDYFQWVDETFLEREGVQSWNELPLWIPSHDEQTRGFNAVDTRRAQRTGLRTRPPAATISDILEAGIPPSDDRRRATKLARDRERDLLRVWRAVKQGMSVA